MVGWRGQPNVVCGRLGTLGHKLEAARVLLCRSALGTAAAREKMERGGGEE